MFPEQNVHFGFGPKAVDVIWVAIESFLVSFHWYSPSAIQIVNMGHTHENLGFKVLLQRWSILLDIVGVIVERAIFFARKKGVRILDHLFVQPVQHVMRHHIVDNN